MARIALRGVEGEENKNLFCSSWHVSSVVAICGRRPAGRSYILLQWPEGGSIFLTFAVAGRFVNLRPRGWSVFLRFALAGGWGGQFALPKRAAQSPPRRKQMRPNILFGLLGRCYEVYVRCLIRPGTRHC